jgi:hypothetical protein
MSVCHQTSYVLRAARNRLSDLRPLLAEVRRILASAVPGEVYLVGGYDQLLLALRPTIAEQVQHREAALQ